ncbi:hypothetical protein VI817_001529 [Penicillium citrinum]|nr:hypothetical protein VI817_001529 [Penicillium citrinum]
MDSYNLAWKLAYSIHGLTPSAANDKSDPILQTYHTERHTIAEELIAFDRDFSSMFSGKIGPSEDGVGGLTHEEFLEVFSRGNGFTSGCGIEYPENIAVNRDSNYVNPISGNDYLSGLLRPGRRLLNVRLVRHADGYRRDLQDGKINSIFGYDMEYNTNNIPDFASTGRFRILCLTSTDLLNPQGVSAKTLNALGNVILRFPPSVIEQVVIHPRLERDFMWNDIPSEIKRYSEMAFYSGFELDDVYKTYGVNSVEGALAVIRPDGYVGIVASLQDVGRLEKFLESLIRTV